MSLSIIIPTLNEAAYLPRLLEHLRDSVQASQDLEIIVADGGSTDGTPELALRHGARLVRCARRGRAPQMNAGAARASGAVLYFLHADTLPPKHFVPLIQKAVAEGFIAGCFRLRFDSNHWWLRLLAWFTRLPLTALRFGDQSLFVTRQAFLHCGGFREDLHLLEDQDLVRRLKARGPFRLLPHAVITSHRKYRSNGFFRLQGIYFLLYFLYRIGMPPDGLARLYQRLIRKEQSGPLPVEPDPLRKP